MGKGRHVDTNVDAARLEACATVRKLVVEEKPEGRSGTCPTNTRNGEIDIADTD
jgi:hypothetical protein